MAGKRSGTIFGMSMPKTFPADARRGVGFLRFSCSRYTLAIAAIECSFVPVMAIIDGLIGRRDDALLPPAFHCAGVTAAITFGYSAGGDQSLG